MSGTALFSIGVRAMTASYVSLQTAGHNIANANVEGYSRQSVALGTTLGQYTGAGYIGRGVDVQSVTRSHDEFLTREAAIAKALSAADSARLYELQQLEKIFKTGEQGLGHATTQLLNAMSDLASRPYDAATREVVLSRSHELASRFTEAGVQLESVQRGVNEGLSASVQSINSLAAGIADINQKIAAARGFGQPPNDLLDERDRLVSKLAEQVQVTTIPAEDGTIGVFIGGGQRVVLGAQAETLTVLADRFDGSRSAIGLSDGSSVMRLSVESLGSGRLAGLLRFQDEDLTAARTMIGQLAAAISGAVNEQQMLGLNLQEPVGTVPSRALFAVGDPVAAPATTNARDVSGGYVGTVALTVTDASQLKASEYKLELDPLGSGQWKLTRLADGDTRLIDSGDEVDGMRIDITNAADTDQFLLQPVTRAAVAMQTLLTDPRDLAAASPLVASTGSANTGTAAIGALTMTATPLDAAATATITFTSANGDYSWDLLDSGGSSIASGTGVWTPGQPIPAPPAADINGFQLTMTGVPALGDTLVIEPTPHPQSNNGNAVALAALRDRILVGRSLQSDGSLTGGTSLNEAYVSALSNIGVRAQSAESTAAISASLAAQVESARASVTGVNLDEEAARLIQFQQSYQAAAKVLQVAQSVFDTLLGVTGG